MNFDTFSILLHHQIVGAYSSLNCQGHHIYLNTGFGPNIVIARDTVEASFPGQTIREQWESFAGELVGELADQIDTYARFCEVLPHGENIYDLSSDVMAFHITGVEQKQVGWPEIAIEFTITVGGSKTEAQTIEII